MISIRRSPGLPLQTQLKMRRGLMSAGTAKQHAHLMCQRQNYTTSTQRSAINYSNGMMNHRAISVLLTSGHEIMKGSRGVVTPEKHQIGSNEYDHYLQKSRHLRQRPFSTQSTSSNYDDLDDLPPLDLTTPSLSIPLPPNLAKEKNDVDMETKPIYNFSSSILSPSENDSVKNDYGDSGSSSSSNGGGGGFTSFLSQGLEKMKEKVSSSPSSSSNSSFVSQQSSNILPSNNSNGSSVSFLSEGLQDMKKQLFDGKLSSKQRGKVRNRLQKKMKENSETKTESFQSKETIRERSAVAEDRQQFLMDDMRVYMQELQKSYPRFGTGQPPQLTDPKRKGWLKKLKGDILESEKLYLDRRNATISGRLQGKMQELYLLQEYGVTPTQWSRIRRETKGNKAKRMATMRDRQRAFYEANASPDLSEEVLPSSMNNLLSTKSSEVPLRDSVVQKPLQTSLPAILTSEGQGKSSSTPNFIRDLITTQANGTILGQLGNTSVLCTVVLSNEKPTLYADAPSAQNVLLGAIQRANAQSGATFVPLQVDYRERYHASGKIPSNRRRRDNSGPLSDKEVLAARAIDRVVRPWLMMGLASSSSSSSSSLEFWSLLPENIVVNCQVQSYDPRQQDQASKYQPRTHADPTALAINSTIAALYQSAYSNPSEGLGLPIPIEAAACVKMGILRDGTAIFDPTPNELEECKLELLYAATKDRVLMLEFSSSGSLPNMAEDPGVDERTVANVLKLAHEAVLPIIERQEALRDEYVRNNEFMVLKKDEGLMTDEEVARLLGFESPMPSVYNSQSGGATVSLSSEDGMNIIQEASDHVWSKLQHVALKLFGGDSNSAPYEGIAQIHEGNLLSKKVRGRRETLLQTEISRLLREDFMPQDPGLAEAYSSAIGIEGEGNSSGCLDALASHIHERTMKSAMAECAAKKLRADGRCGLNIVRPITATAPIFPDSVHGSALFSRGETQVLCTATVGSPREGMPMSDPYAKMLVDDAGKIGNRGHDDDIPVGSLRFLRNQEALESDMNSRKVLAGREMVGDSGILSEVKRAFLHYDFPDHSTGVIKSRVGASANRRAIGHGNLAEKAVLPALPHLNDFPYTIRLTSEVTSSNGSSSMASACGASLALLDAGVPLISPVAGLSVGLSPLSNELLLDITGTEDHYGDMDFKICGTYDGITAMQLDVKQALPLETVVKALDLAKEGRRAILNAMERQCGLQPRTSMKSTAPRVEVIQFDPNRKRDLIGPGGSVLRQLEDRFNVSLDLSQEGQCLIFGPIASVSQAKSIIMDLVSDVEEGGIYEGTVIEIKDFGAVVELLRNKEGLLHVSEITDAEGRHPGGNIGLIKSHLKVGDKIEVLCTKIDHVQGSIRLSQKKLLQMRKNTSKVDTFPINAGTSADSQTNSYYSNPSSRSNDSQTKSNEEKGQYRTPYSTSSSQKVEQLLSQLADTDQNENFDTEIIDIDDMANDDDTDIDDIDNDEDVSDEEEDEDIDAAHVSSGSSEYSATNPNDVQWMETFNELEKYKTIHGDTNVTRRSTDFPVLANWVHWQRQVYKKGKMPNYRVQKLNAIGFEFSPSAKAWEQKFNELKEYASVHGHCKVTPKDNSTLNQWTHKQRNSYKNGRLSDARIKQLEEVGFQWSIHSTS